MLINKTPLFMRGSILTKEMLTTMNDNPMELIDLGFANKCNGIISGLGLRYNEGQLIVDKGIFKYNGTIYTLNNECTLKVPFTSGNYILKIIVEDEKIESDETGSYKYRKCDIILNTLGPLRKNEIELCRFGYSGNNSKIIVEYDQFSDIDTVSNVIDIKHIKYSDSSEYGTLHPVVFRLFAKDMIRRNKLDAIDIAFIMQCLNAQIIKRECIMAYLSLKLGEVSNKEQLENVEIYSLLSKILKDETNKSKFDNYEKRNIEEKMQSMEIW